MSDPNYGKMYVIKALKAILVDPKATVKQRLDAAHLIATIHGWEKPAAKGKPPQDEEASKLLGLD